MSVQTASPLHLLYVPTLGCNLACDYCYLGHQTDPAKIQQDVQRAAQTLRKGLAMLEAEGLLAFNVSLHGGEPTLMPEALLDDLFTQIRGHYSRHFDRLQALGHKKSAPHIKTNLYRFKPLLALFDRHKVSISASVDLPLDLHAKHRITRAGQSSLPRILENLTELARYPHAKKISCTLSQDHVKDPAPFINDVWRIHRETGFDMNMMNIMFAFPSRLNDEDKGPRILQVASEAQMLDFKSALQQAFMGTELEDGLRRHWFDEFTPSYCTHMRNCAERFFLLQSDGSVYSCVRGQGLPEFHYGNIEQDSWTQIRQRGEMKIDSAKRAIGFSSDCGGCSHLSRCNTGCPAASIGGRSDKSYTCGLQKSIYAEYPQTYPADDEAKRQAYRLHYLQTTHPDLALKEPPLQASAPTVALSREFDAPDNALLNLVARDPRLRRVFEPGVFTVELDGDVIPLHSQLLAHVRQSRLVSAGSRLKIHFPADLVQDACEDPVVNTLYLQILRDTRVVYGDEQRSKQEHLFNHMLYFPSLRASAWRPADHLEFDLGALLGLHHALFAPGVLNNVFFTTSSLRDAHYAKQRSNGFYHAQTLNLPFHNFEFYWMDSPSGETHE